MEENAKIQDGSDKTLLISISMVNKQYVLLYFSTYKLWMNTLWYVQNIFGLFRLIIYVLYSFTRTYYLLSTFISKVNKLHVLLYFSTYKLQVNTLWYLKNIYCFLD